MQLVKVGANLLHSGFDPTSKRERKILSLFGSRGFESWPDKFVLTLTSCGSEALYAIRMYFACLEASNLH